MVTGYLRQFDALSIAFKGLEDKCKRTLQKFHESKRAMEEVGFCRAELCSSESELEEAPDIGQAWRTPSTFYAECDDVDHEMIKE